MIDVGILEKIKKLKQRLLNEDYEQSAKDTVDEWEKNLLELSELQDFLLLNNTQKIIAAIKGRIKQHIHQKLNKRDLTLEQIHRLDDKIDEDKYILSFFTPNVNDQITDITNQIEQELV